MIPTPPCPRLDNRRLARYVIAAGEWRPAVATIQSGQDFPNQLAEVEPLAAADSHSAIVEPEHAVA